jgi:lipopolysaccharide transport system permease protein
MKKHPMLIIESKNVKIDYWSDVWHFRDLFFVLALRDISVRYKQTVLGVSWALIQPIMTMLVFTVIFGHLANLSSTTNTPYPLLVFSGLLPWQLFSSSLASTSSSLVNNSNLITKVYFPRLIVPLASIAVSCVDFLINLSILVVLMLWYKVSVGPQIFALPLLMVATLLAIVGPGLLLAALNVKYRDFRYIVPLILQLGLYISPVGFSSDVVPDKWRILYFLNPMAGVIDGFRWIILGGNYDLYLPGLLVSSTVILLLAFIGVRQFKKMEDSFADLI